MQIYIHLNPFATFPKEKVLYIHIDLHSSTPLTRFTQFTPIHKKRKAKCEWHSHHCNSGSPPCFKCRNTSDKTQQWWHVRLQLQLMVSIPLKSSFIFPNLLRSTFNKQLTPPIVKYFNSWKLTTGTLLKWLNNLRMSGDSVMDLWIFFRTPGCVWRHFFSGGWVNATRKRDNFKYVWE